MDIQSSIVCFNGRLYRLVNTDSIENLDKSIVSTYYDVEESRFVECYYDEEKGLWIENAKIWNKQKILTSILYHSPSNIKGLKNVEDENLLVEYFLDLAGRYNPNSHLLFYPKLDPETKWN